MRLGPAQVQLLAEADAQQARAQHTPCCLDLQSLLPSSILRLQPVQMYDYSLAL